MRTEEAELKGIGEFTVDIESRARILCIERVKLWSHRMGLIRLYIVNPLGRAVWSVAITIATILGVFSLLALPFVFAWAALDRVNLWELGNPGGLFCQIIATIVLGTAADWAGFLVWDEVLRTGIKKVHLEWYRTGKS